MTKTQHTPGPWDRHYETVECKTSGRKWRRDYITVTRKDRFVEYIADVNGQCDGNTSANARLIAAAPELLAELEKADKIILELQRFAYELGAQGTGWPYMRQSERGAAIAKAKGE